MPARGISRRTVLRGLGAAITLPVLEAMNLPTLGADGTANAASQRRMVVLSMPMGVHPWTWFPRKTGANYQLTYAMSPLKEFKNDILIFNQLYNAAASKSRNPHVRTSGCFLTSLPCNDALTSRAQARVGGPSFDQVAAQAVGKNTRIPSLHLAADPLSTDPHCVYGDNVSWVNQTRPAERLHDPLALYHRIFGIGDDTRFRADLLRDRGLLDQTNQEAKALRNRLGRNDQRRLDEYLESVRSVEKQMAVYLSPDKDSKFPPPPKGFPVPPEVPSRDKHTRDRLMLELLALAIETDSTRIITFSFGADPGPGVSGVGGDHHWVSHHGHRLPVVQQYSDIIKYGVNQFAWLLNRLKTMREGQTNVLDQSMVLFAGAMGDGNTHHFRNLPVILAGRAGGSIQPGRFVECPNDTPLANLFLAMMQRMEVKSERFADSTEPLKWLTVDPMKMPGEPSIDMTDATAKEVYFTDPLIMEKYFGPQKA